MNASRSLTEGDFARPPVTRGELVLVLLIVLTGFALRLAWPSCMSVEHFDEGVYASNLWFSAEEDFRYPGRHFYAPPLLPALIEWSQILFGPSDLSSLLVNLLAGGLTVALVWWVARRWFGPEAAPASAALAACSDFHILYSRTALTDPLLCFWWLLAVYLIWEVYRRPGRHRMVAAGVAAGLAWCTKYNGWLPLAIGLAGLAGWGLLERTRRAERAQQRKQPGRRALGYWLGIAVIAVAVWSPVWWGLQDDGGYSVVAANHARYLVGLDGWPASFQRQLGNHWYFDGWLSCLGLGAALLLPAFALQLHTTRFTWNAEPARPLPRWFTVVAGTLGLVALGSLLGSSVVIGVLGGAGILLHLRNANRRGRGGKDGREAAPASGEETSLAAWLLAAWFAGLLIATPLYHPYPRLTLPWLVAGWLGAGAGIAALLQRFTASAPRPSQRDWKTPFGAAVAGIVSAGVLLWQGPRLTAHGVPGWQDRTGLKTVARSLAEEAASALESTGSTSSRQGGPEFVTYVYGEPALVFHLSLIEDRRTDLQYVAQPVNDLGFADPEADLFPAPMFLIVRERALQTGDLADQWSRYRHRFRDVGAFEYTPSDLVLLNEFAPDKLAGSETPPPETIRLYQLR